MSKYEQNTLIKMLCFSLAGLITFSLSGCATALRQQRDSINQMAAQWKQERDLYFQQVAVENKAWTKFQEREKSLLPEMSTEQLEEYSQACKAWRSPVDYELALRKLDFASTKNAELHDSIVACLTERGKLLTRGLELLSDYQRLEAQRQNIVQAYNSYLQERHRRRIEAAQGMAAFAQFQNGLIMREGFSNLNTTIQNQGSLGRTVVVPRN